MGRNYLFLIILHKVNHGHSPQMKKSMSDSYIKYKTTKTIPNQIYMGNYIQETKTHWDITQMQNFTTRRQKTTKIKKEDVGPFSPSQENRHISVSLCPSYQIYSKEKLGNTLIQHQLKQKTNNLFGIKRENHQSCILNKFPKTLVDTTNFKAWLKCLQVKLLNGGIPISRDCKRG